MPPDGIQTIRPRSPREIFAREALGDEDLTTALITGIDMYRAQLANDAKSSDTPVDMEKADFMLSTLSKLIKIGLQDTQKVYDSSRYVASKYQKTGQVVFGHRIPNTGESVLQVCIHVKKPEDEDTEGDNFGFAKSTRGRSSKSAGDIAIQRVDHPASLSVSLQEVSRDPENPRRGIQIHDSLGIVIDFAANGSVRYVQGLTFKGNTPHFTDPIDPTPEESAKLDSCQGNQGLMDAINAIAD